jgi:hypothetical protein
MTLPTHTDAARREDLRRERREVAREPVIADAHAPRGLSPQRMLDVQRSAGNAAAARMVARSREAERGGQPERGRTLQRKHADLALTDLTGVVDGKYSGAVTRLITQYNATKTWDQVGADKLKEQVEADDATIFNLLTQLSAALESLNATDQLRVAKEVSPLQGQLEEHKKAIAAEKEKIRAAEQEAKPLRERQLGGLKNGKGIAYKRLVGDAAKVKDLSDTNVAELVKLFDEGTQGHILFSADALRRERERKGLGGAGGWVTELLGPHRGTDVHAGEALRLIGDAATAGELGLDVVIKIIYEAHHAKVAGANDVSLYLGGKADELAAGESTESVEAKTEEAKRKGDELRAAGLAKLGGGTTWEALSGAIEEWFRGLKERAAQDTFKTAFEAGRMTVRAISAQSDEETAVGFREFEAQVPEGEAGTTTGKAKMKLGRGRETILKRVKPETWTGTDDAVKTQTGLRELSASLLNPDRDIYPQLKFYTEPEAVVFMPASSPDDLQIFAAISQLKDADQGALRRIGAEITRIIRAQASDMGTKYVDFSSGNAGTDIRYGDTGTIIRYAGGTGKAARKHELEWRRTNALQYTEILEDLKQVVNEVVVEYRKHASGKFPLFTQIDHDAKCFHILDPITFRRTGKYIDTNGEEK